MDYYMFYSDPHEPIIAFAVCDSSPSEQMYNNPNLVHTMGFITLPSESKVTNFLSLIEEKLSIELDKPSKLRHWKKYRNTPRGIKTKEAIFSVILEAVSETAGINLFVFYEKEKSIVDSHLKHLDFFNLSQYLTIENDKYTFGPFDLPISTVSLKKRALGRTSISKNSAVGILNCAFNQIRLFNELKRIYNKIFPLRPFTLDLRLDLLPNDKVKNPQKLYCLMGLLVKATNGGITPVAQLLDKNNSADIIADNITGMFAMWYKGFEENNLNLGENQSGKAYGASDGIHVNFLE